MGPWRQSAGRLEAPQGKLSVGGQFKRFGPKTNGRPHMATEATLVMTMDVARFIAMVLTKV